MKKLLILGLVLVGVLLVGHAWAQVPSDALISMTNSDQTYTQTDAQISLGLSQTLYCQTKWVLSGNIGLLIGLLIALLGLYQMVNGALMGGLILLICGALITALPSLVESFLQGAYIVAKPLQGNNTGASGQLCIPTCNNGVASQGPGCPTGQ